MNKKVYCVEDDEGHYVKVLDAQKCHFSVSDVMTDEYMMTEQEANAAKTFGDFIGSMFSIRKIGDVQ